MQPIAKFLIISGIVLIVLGVLWQLGLHKLPLGRLPGDIAVERPGVRLYFPVATSIILSVGLSLILYLIQRFRGQ